MHLCCLFFKHAILSFFFFSSPSRSFWHGLYIPKKDMLILLHLELHNMELLYHFSNAIPEHQQTLLGCARTEYGFPMEAVNPSELWAQG